MGCSSSKPKKGKTYINTDWLIKTDIAGLIFGIFLLILVYVYRSDVSLEQLLIHIIIMALILTITTFAFIWILSHNEQIIH